MVCTNCNTRFCWVCGKEGNHVNCDMTPTNGLEILGWTCMICCICVLFIFMFPCLIVAGIGALIESMVKNKFKSE